jgi:hypothetical protein
MVVPQDNLSDLAGDFYDLDDEDDIAAPLAEPVESIAPPSGEHDFDDTSADDDEGDDGDHSRKMHHNIPTWTDAIGMVIDHNLELRAKSGHTNQPRGRRGRGRGRSGPKS